MRRTAAAPCTLPITRWYIFIASSEGWGTVTKPVSVQDLQADCPVSFVSLGVPPGPLVPNISYPANNAILSLTSVNIKYDSRIDADRNSPNWPATYDVFVKHWLSGATEPTSWGKVTAKVDVSSSVYPALRPLVLTNSHNIYFSVNTGRCFGCGR